MIDTAEVKRSCIIEMTEGTEIPENIDQLIEGVDATCLERGMVIGLEMEETGTKGRTGQEKELKGKKSLQERDMGSAEGEKRMEDTGTKGRTGQEK